MSLSPAIDFVENARFDLLMGEPLGASAMTAILGRLAAALTIVGLLNIGEAEAKAVSPCQLLSHDEVSAALGLDAGPAKQREITDGERPPEIVVKQVIECQWYPEEFRSSYVTLTVYASSNEADAHKTLAALMLHFSRADSPQPIDIGEVGWVLGSTVLFCQGTLNINVSLSSGDTGAIRSYEEARRAVPHLARKILHHLK